MKELIDFVSNPVVAAFLGGAGAMVLSAAARALPEPEPGNDKTYRFWYNFAHNMLANFDKTRKLEPK
jgi:MFS superfamily sulfate permease-like transporter